MDHHGQIKDWFDGGCVVYDGDGRLVADLSNAIPCGMTPDEVEANAKLIVAAVNHYRRTNG